VVGTGDFNGDSNSDILWRDTSGNTSIWFMNGTQRLSRHRKARRRADALPRAARQRFAHRRG
jgi:hypothetical protein